jgi:ElaB/YqjD/DUF883 family membrane-anchored ribosome-binding protein
MQLDRGMQPNTNAPSEPAAAGEPLVPARVSKAMSFAREHPALSVIGAATFGLLGGIELAAGVLLGAGVARLIGRNGRAAAPHEEHAMRERARKLLERTPPEARKRMRAIVQAARGKIAPAEQPKPTPQQQEQQQESELLSQAAELPA